MKNYEVCQAFMKGLSVHTKNMNSTGVELYSYNAKIAEWRGRELWIMDPTTYRSSVTTLQHIYNLVDCIYNMNYNLPIHYEYCPYRLVYRESGDFFAEFPFKCIAERVKRGYEERFGTKLKLVIVWK